ncbi:MAG TPA: hypothetical protein PKO09_05180 [Anaerolineae bacterium]|nr:hypothetical protein [Anaerolineae bacterium]
MTSEWPKSTLRVARPPVAPRLGWRTWSSGLVTLLALLSLSACAGKASPGDSVHYRRSFSFYMATSVVGRYLQVQEVDYPRILEGAEWDLDDGLEMVDSDLSLAPTPVSWIEGGEKHTAKGVRLTVDVTVRVAEGAGPGWRGIRLRLPGLLSYGKTTGTGASFPGEGPGFTIHDGFTVAGVTVE